MKNHTRKDLYDAIMTSNQHLWVATDVLKRMGDKNVNSHSPGYRLAHAVLDRMVSDGLMQKRYFPHSGLTVYWRIP